MSRNENRNIIFNKNKLKVEVYLSLRMMTNEELEQSMEFIQNILQEAKLYRELKAKQKAYSNQYRKTDEGKEKRRLAQQKYMKKKTQKSVV
jgi:hypothetical protein